jgi:hypothetical protein
VDNLLKGCGQFVADKVVGNDVAKLETQGGFQLGNWSSSILLPLAKAMQ